MKIQTDLELSIELICFLTKKTRNLPELTEEFSVSERTMERWIQNLIESGFELHKTSIKHGARRRYKIIGATPALKLQIKQLYEQFKIH